MELPPKIASLLTYLAIIIDRNGGTLTVENLSQYAGTDVKLDTETDIKGDKVTIKAAITKKSNVQ